VSDTGESIEVPAALDGERVDRAVALITGWSRGDVQTMLDAGTILVDGSIVAKSYKLRAGAVVELLGEPAPDTPPAPDPSIAVDVRDASADVIVVAKPAGLVVHPGAGHDGGTLVNGLLARYPEIAGVGDPMRPGIVHRLDRDTSGLMLVARSQQGYDALVAQLSAREVERQYVALVWGRLASRRGLIDAPIGRSTARRTRMAVRGEGKEARTEYEVHATFDDPVCSLVHCRLQTGRTHQIRVHFDAIGHPVVGDATYGGLREPLRIDRPFLHAAVLAFDDPATGERRRFEEPLPPELQTILDDLTVRR
jgi:23S rRNA pseudouridine1911/1915/1917 synthase